MNGVSVSQTEGGRIETFGGFWFSETEFYYVEQVGLELTMLLPLPPRCWDYRSVSPSPALRCPDLGAP
jgi:hypothetical protein